MFLSPALRRAETPAPPARPLSERTVRRAREIIHESFAEDLHLGELSEGLHVSKEHLVRTFHSRYGMPPTPT